MKIVFATGNKGKLREASEILGNGFELVTPAEFGITENIPETGSTLKENSRQKTLYISSKIDCNCFADDSGLEVDILGGAPGVYTARFAGEGRDFNDNMDKLLQEMASMEMSARSAAAMGLSVKKTTRNARFRCVVTLMYFGQMHIFEGVLEGKIALAKSGTFGFGYDPVFIPNEYPDKTLAEISETEKNAISHRSKALHAMAQWLDKNGKH